MVGWTGSRGAAVAAAVVIGVLVPVTQQASAAPAREAHPVAATAPAAASAGPAAAPASAGPGAAPGPAAAPVAPAPQAPAITHREERVDTPAGPVTVDIVVADLNRAELRATLLTGAMVGERSSVPAHARRGGAVAAINGDFFDLARSNAAAGPSVRDGRALTSAVPPGRRLAPGVPGAQQGDVLAIDDDGTPRLDRLTLDASVTGPKGRLRIDTLNAYAVPVGGIGLFTSDWAGDRAATLCGSDTDRDAPCAPDRVEVVVRDGAVTAVGPPGGGAIPAGEQVLAGRDQGAAALRGLAVGDRVTVRQALTAASGTAPRTAVGASPILRDGAPVAGLDTRSRDPRSAAGYTAQGRLILLTADGRESTSVGITLAETAEQLRRAGAVDGVNLDGGGSSTMVFRDQVVNSPSEDAYRLVPNALGVVEN
ncbi:phosphodiester glycosidase family protein [Pseudonocardia sp. TMWB2A]|uniref:phosphodiester glycosidase family protein n=1 Tax=Pseudonocardia sp. TMWB2A TaxID=687430 RepID=UPI00307F296F